MSFLSRAFILLALLGYVVSAQVPVPKWSLIHKFESGNEMYFDNQLGRYEGYLVIRILKNVPSNKTSFVSTIAIDCKAKAASTIQLDVYSTLMATGDPANSIGAKQGSFEFIPFDKFPMPPEIKFPELCNEACRSRSGASK